MMALSVCCMRVALASAAFVPCASSVRTIPPPKNRAGSVLSSGLCLVILLRLLLCPLRRSLHHGLPPRLCGFARLASSLSAPPLASAHSTRNGHLFLGAAPAL